MWQKNLASKEVPVVPMPAAAPAAPTPRVALMPRAALEGSTSRVGPTLRVALVGPVDPEAPVGEEGTTLRPEMLLRLLRPHLTRGRGETQRLRLEDREAKCWSCILSQAVGRGDGQGRGERKGIRVQGGGGWQCEGRDRGEYGGLGWWERIVGGLI